MKAIGGLANAAHGLRSSVRLGWRAAPWSLAGQVTIAAVAGLSPVATAWLTRTVLSGVAKGDGLPGIAPAAIALVTCGLLIGAVAQAGTYLRAVGGRATNRLAQRELFAAVARHPGLARLEDPGYLNHLVLAQQAGGGGDLLGGVVGLASSAITIVGLAVELGQINVYAALLVVLAGVPAFAAQMRLSGGRIAQMWDLSPAQRRELGYSALLTDVAAGAEIRMFGISRFLRDRINTIRTISDRERDALDRRQVRTETGYAVANAIAIGAGLLLVIAHAARSAAGAGGGGVGDVGLYIVAAAGVEGALSGIISAIVMIHQSSALMEHFRTVLETGPDLCDGTRVAGPLGRLVEFKDVWFRYSDEHPWVLRGVSFRIEVGTAVGLVGLNGAGKSTIVKLLCRFYDPTRGTIEWDGVDLREHAIGTLRARMGVLLQEFMRYEMTVRENIGVGDIRTLDDADGHTAADDPDGAILASARQAGIADAIDALPAGLDTMLTRIHAPTDDVDSANVPLSGGQWQRLALARAFHHVGTDLLILDEPSSGLDAEAEAEIHRAIRRHRSGRTSLLITHRLGAMRAADRIIVLADGVIAEAGDHRSLLAADGIYAGLFRTQAASMGVGGPEVGDPDVRDADTLELAR